MTVLEQRFMEYTVPELVRQMKQQNELLKAINENLAKLTGSEK